MKYLKELLKKLFRKPVPKMQISKPTGIQRSYNGSVAKRFCDCEIDDYDVFEEYDKDLGCNYEERECKICGHYWEGPIY